MTVSPGWYDDGVTPGVERWFDGRSWSESTRRAVAVPATPSAVAPQPVAPQPVALQPVVPIAASGALWVPQEMPALPAPEPLPVAPLADPFAGGYARSMLGSPDDAAPYAASAVGPRYDGAAPRATHHAAPAGPSFAVPVLEPDPARAPSAAAAGYPSFGTPYRAPDAGPPAGAAGAAAASPYTNAAAARPAASPYTNAAAAPYAGVPYASASYPSPPPPAPAPAPPAAGYPAAGYPAAGGFPLRPASQDLIERAFRAEGRERANGHRQTAVILGFLGVVLLVIAGGVLRITVGSGTGMVWTWGFVAGAVLLVKAVMSYVKGVRGGAPHFGPVGWLVSGGAVLVAVLVVVTSLQAAFSPMPVEVGSCFTDQGPDVQHVDCADPHDYTAVAVVDSLMQCPSLTDVTARLDDQVVCLVDAGFGLGN